MVDLALLRDHYRLKIELKDILEEDDKRRHLISTAFLELCRRFGSKSGMHHEENDKFHQQELLINKLKQQVTTREKVIDLKIESYKEEIKKLKQQIKVQPRQNIAVPQGSKLPDIYNSNLSAGFSTSPYVNKISFAGLDEELENIPSSQGSLILPGKQSETILTPMKKKREVGHNPKKAKRIYTNFNTMKKNFDDAKNVTHEEFQQMKNGSSTPLASSNVLKEIDILPEETIHESVGNSPSTSGRLFDVQDKSFDEVVNQSITPSKSQKRLDSTHNITANSISSADTEISESSFVSADSSSLSVSKSGKKKVLKLWKSRVSKVDSSSTSHKEGKAPFNLEDEDMNTLDYYHDDNFLDENTDSTPSRKRKLADSSYSLSSPITYKKKKNVFKIS